MSTATAFLPDAAERQRVHRTRMVLYVSLAALCAVSLARALSSEDDLTSSFTISQTVISTLPILMAGLGGLLSERSGIVNIGLEGMMVLGTWGAGFFGFHWGPWGALFGAMFCGAIGGLLHAVVTVSFGVDQVISGVAINLLAAGWTRFLSAALFKGRGSGSETNSPGFDVSKGMPTLRFPGMSANGWFADLEKKHYVFISDFAGIARGLLGSWPLYRLFAVAMLPLVAYVVWRTKFGLRLRAAGEKPSAADSLGVPVNRIRYLAVCASGSLAGLGGAMLVLYNSGSYVEGQTQSKGFLGLASLIFGNWRPMGVLGGASLFGFLDTVQLTAEPAVVGMYLLVAIGALYGAYRLLRPKAGDDATPARGINWSTRAFILVGMGLGLIVLFATDTKLNTDLVKGLPYLGTLVVLAVFSRRLRPPMAAGQPYRKGQIG